MNLIPFAYAGFSVRVVEIDGEPWFVASDITPILGYQHGPSAIRRLDLDEYRSVPFALVDSTVRPGFGPQSITVVSESGAYSLILWSQKEEAKPFARAHLPHSPPRISAGRPGDRRTGGPSLDDHHFVARMPLALALG